VDIINPGDIMYLDKEKLKTSISLWEEKLKGYSLPSWEQLPGIDLYMDQVLSLLEMYLGIYYEMADSQKFITASMINNYVKLNIIPAPHKKKYSKKHIAYLLIVCTLKQTLDMATIKKILPLTDNEEEIKAIYSSFTKNQRKSYDYVTENVRKISDPLLEFEGDNPERINDLILQVASTANVFKILTERITKLTEEEQ
jgi:DNA-binding transcriptional MerR regulator